MRDTTLIIPTLNEEKNIGPLLDLLQHLYPSLKILVVDDGSVDRTREIAHAHHIPVLDRSSALVKGIAASVVDAATLVTTPTFMVIDGDFQHPPEKIQEIYEQLKRAVLVIGKRVKIANAWPLHRRLMSFIATFLGRLRLLNKPFRSVDIMSGFFGINTSLFKKTYDLHKLSYHLKGYKILFMTLKYLPQEISFIEVPYIFGDRKYGASKINHQQIFIFFKSLFC